MFYNFHARIKGFPSIRLLKTSLVVTHLSLLSLTFISLVMVSLFSYSPLSVAQSNNKHSTTQESTLTLSFAIKKTLTKHPALKVFKFRQDELVGQLQSQDLKPAYEIGFEMENFAGTGDVGILNSAEFTLSLSSILEMGNKRNARINVIKNRRSQLNATREIEALNLLGEVTRRYIDIIAAQERLLLAKEATLLAEETLTEVEKRSKAGLAPEAEIKRALAAVGNARLIASSEQQQLDYAKMALTMMWNETTPAFTKVEGNLYQFSADITFEKLYAKVNKNPEILLYATEERLREAQLRLARTESSADIKWSVGIKQIQDLNDTALTAGFSMPLFSSKRNKGAIISAQASRDEVAVKREATMLALHNQLYRAYANRKQAIFTVKSLKNSIIPTLEEALDETQMAYQRGRYSYLDYLTARQELLFARRAMIEAAASALRYGTQIEQLIAEPLSYDRKSASQSSISSLINITNKNEF